MPNGLCSEPRTFNKLLKPILAELRLDHAKIAAYIDDLIALAYSFGICFENVRKCVELLFNLGFVVLPEKSVFVPSQEIENTGIINNSVTMTVRLITEKKKKTFDFCQEGLLKESFSTRLVSKLLDKLNCSFEYIKYGQLYYRDQKREKTMPLKFDKGNFEEKNCIDSLVKQDIIW